MFFPFVGFGLKAKNPRLTGNRGFQKLFFVLSEFHSLDAKTPANARPNGHASGGLRVL